MLSIQMKTILQVFSLLMACTIVNAEVYTIFGVERDIDIESSAFPSDQELAALEDAMPPMEHGWMDSVIDLNNGEPAQLHYRKWLPSTAPKAVVIYTHGIQSHSGKSHVFSSTNGDATTDRKVNTALLANALLNDNVALYAVDLYGHGYSEGARFFIPESYQTNVDDLLNFVKLVGQDTQDTPIMLMGESYGGTLSLHVAAYFQDIQQRELGITDVALAARIDSIILTSPAIEVDTPACPVLQILTGLASVFPRWTPFFMPNPVSPDRIWRDPQVLELRTDPEYAGNKIDGSGLKLRLGTAVAVLQAVEDVRDSVIPSLSLPFLTLHGTADEAVLPQGSEFLFHMAATPANDKSYVPKEAAYHDLLAEPENVAEECVQAILDWIHLRLSTSSR